MVAVPPADHLRMVHAEIQGLQGALPLDITVE